MIDSNLQGAIDVAWPGIEGVVRAARDATPAGKSLAALKEAFTQRTLPATSADVPLTGGWRRSPGPSPVKKPPVVLRSRTYYAEVPKGLVDLAASVSLDADQLRSIQLAPTDSTAPATGAAATPPAKKSVDKQLPPEELLATPASPAGPAAVVAMANAAVDQQIAHAMHALTHFEAHEHPTATLVEAVRHGRLFLDTTDALTAVVRTGALAGLDDEKKKQVIRKLAGGTLVDVPWDDLKDDVLVVRRRPSGATWYTATDLKVGWDPILGRAQISVVSRLLLDILEPWVPRYRAPFTT